MVFTMSFWYSKYLDEPTVIWAPPIRDGLGGYTWLLPSSMLGRWQYSHGAVGPTVKYFPEGSEVVARTSVWLGSWIAVGSYLWKGSMDDAPTDGIEATASQVIAVKNVRSIPTSNVVYRCYLDET